MLQPVPRSRPVGRYAPSPTGELHLGNLRTALIAFEQAPASGGLFLLRIEDTDLPRNVPGAELQLIEDLHWLGITWDEGPDVGGPAWPYRQSERGAIYREALLELARRGLIYPCTCSRKDLQSAASAPHGPDGIVYPGTCRREVSFDEAQALIAQLLHPSRHPRDQHACLRIRSDRLSPVRWMDELEGPQEVDLAADAGDFVVLRRDGLWAYQMVCAVDDALMGVTSVVRGRDLLNSAPRQVAVMSALGLQPPTYRHTPLVADAEGNRMSKRDGSQSLRSLRETGQPPKEVLKQILSLPVLDAGLP